MPSRRHRKLRSRADNKNFPELGRQFRAVDDSDQIRRLLADILTKKVVTVNAMELPLKSTRLQQLLEARFNCADYRHWMRNQLDREELRDLSLAYRKLSLRTFTDERYDQPSPRLPVAYGVGKWSAIETFCVQNNQNYHTLVNQFLPLKESLYTGNLILLGKDQYIASVIKGFGTPRDVDVPRIDIEVFLGGFGDEAPNMPRFIPEVANLFRNFMAKLRPITVEFSYYPYPVGLLKQQEIFWEWRGGSVHDLSRIISHLFLQASSYQATLKLDR